MAGYKTTLINPHRAFQGWPLWSALAFHLYDLQILFLQISTEEKEELDHHLKKMFFFFKKKLLFYLFYVLFLLCDSLIKGLLFLAQCELFQDIDI